VNFADRASGRIYLRTEHGQPVWTDAQALAAAVSDAETRAGIAAVAPQVLQSTGAAAVPRLLQELIGADRIHTLGNWGGTAAHS
jgi:hypothetical protein